MLASRRRLPTVAHDCNDIECEDYHGSQNICQWLRGEEQKQAMRAAGGAGERLEQRWILVFNGGPEMTQMEEAYSMCLRMFEERLHITHRCPLCATQPHPKGQLILQVAARPDVLRREAADIGLPMRLQETKGMMPFSEAAADLFVHTPNDTAFNSAQEQFLVMSRINRCLLVPLAQRKELPDRRRALQSFRWVVDGGTTPITSRLLSQLLTTFGAYTPGRAEVIGPTCAYATRLTEIDDYFTVAPPMTAKGLQRCWACVARNGAALERGVRGALGTAATEWSEERQLQKLQQLQYNNQSKKDSELGQLQKLRYLSDKGLTEYVPLEWKDVENLLKELDDYARGAGRDERFTGTLHSFYPTHDLVELKFFTRQWADLSLVLGQWRNHWFLPTCRMRARSNEGKNTSGGHYNPNSVANYNPSRQPHQCSLWYQPIDEIRDYFGDDYALYFAWIGLYTRSLATLSVLGVVVMLYGSVTARTIDPDKNDLTLLYSVFVAVWSVMFLQRWARRENELRFLWGTEAFAEDQEPRHNFKGKIIVTGFPPKETLVESSRLNTFLRKSVSWSAVLAMMCATVVVGLIAEGLSSRKDEWWMKFDVDGDGFINRTEFRALGERLGSPTIDTDALMDDWMDPNDAPNGVMSSVQPVCSILRGRCVVDDDPANPCQNWIDQGHCKTAFDNSTGVPTNPDPDSVSFGAAWRQSPYNGRKTSVAQLTWKEFTTEYLWVGVSAVFNLIVLQTFGFLFRKLSIVLNDFDNHRLEQQYKSALITKVFAFAFVNNYFVLFYIAYFKHLQILPRTHLPFGEPVCSADDVSAGVCDHEYEQVWQRPVKCDESCMSALQIKIFIVFTGKTYGMKLLEYGKPMLKRCQCSKGDGEADPEDVSFSKFSRLEPAQGTFSDFSQMVIQFGYLALFAPACSLAPLLAFINNVTEIRTDAWKVCNLYQRPAWERAQSIGGWFVVLKTLAMAAVIVNSTMVFFVGSQMACPHDDAYLSNYSSSTPEEQESIAATSGSPTFAEKFPASFCFAWESPSSSVRKPTLGDAMELDGISYRITVSRLWVLTICMEHLVLLLRWALESLAPTIPNWIETARDTLEHKMRHLHGDADVANEAKILQRSGAADPEQVFANMDEDGDGMLNIDEIGKCASAMGMHLNKCAEPCTCGRLANQCELRQVVNQMDGDGDGLVTFDEFGVWWSVYGGKNKFQLKDAREIFKKLDVDDSKHLDESELQQLCTELGMKTLSRKNAERLKNDLDVDGDGEVDIDEFDIWWRENGGESFSPCPPPAPGDMGRRKKFELAMEFLRAHNLLDTPADAAVPRTTSSDAAPTAAGRTPLPGSHTYDVETPAVHGTAARPDNTARRSRSREDSGQLGGADGSDTETSRVVSNPLHGGHAWDRVRGSQRQAHVTQIAKRAASMLAPHPSHLKVDPAAMSSGELLKARQDAALDDRVDRLLFGHGDSASPPAPPPRPGARQSPGGVLSRNAGLGDGGARRRAVVGSADSHGLQGARQPPSVAPRPRAVAGRAPRGQFQ